MRLFSVLFLMIATAFPALAATTWPASTNANQTFFGANTFALKITGLTLTPSTVLQADASRGVISVPNGLGFLTNDGVGNFSWVPVTIPNLNNLWVLNSNNVANATSNTIISDVAIYGSLYIYSTNPVSTISNLHVTGWSQLDGPVTNLALTANTVLEGNADKGIASIANGTGFFTNNGSGTFGWMPASSLITTNPPDSWHTNLYVRNLYATNVYVQQLSYYTNLSTMAPDFSKGYAAITTNAAFAFLNPINLDATKTMVQTAVVRVDNSSGPTPIAVTLPANVHAVPGSVFWITNSTYFTWSYYSPDQTNCYAVPIY